MSKVIVLIMFLLFTNNIFAEKKPNKSKNNLNSATQRESASLLLNDYRDVFVAFSSCDNSVPSNDVEAIKNSVNCYNKYLGKNLSERDKVLISHKFLSFDNITNIRNCSNKESKFERLRDEYTPTSLCFTVFDKKNNENNYVVYFEYENEIPKIVSLYKLK